MTITTMWAMRLAGPYAFIRTQVAVPAPGDLDDGQVLLRVITGGICGSDIPYFRGVHPIPEVPGLVGRLSAELPGFPMHEVVGEVVASRHPETAVGSYVVGWARGMNGLAEFVVTRGDSVAGYDTSLDPGAAIMLQPLACVLDAVDQIAEVEGARVAVVGLGPIGLLFTHVLHDRGAALVTGVDQVSRREVGAEFGIGDLVHASADWWASSLGDSLGDGARPQIVVEAVGHQVRTLCDAVSAAQPGGQIFYFGIPDDPVYPFPMSEFVRKNLRLTSGVTRDRRGALLRASAYLARYPNLPSAYVTDVFDVEQATQAYTLASRPAERRLKVVLAFGPAAG
jgi:L-iditol 2-dehydrogenase